MALPATYHLWKATVYRQHSIQDFLITKQNKTKQNKTKNMLPQESAVSAPLLPLPLPFKNYINLTATLKIPLQHIPITLQFFYPVGMSLKHCKSAM